MSETKYVTVNFPFLGILTLIFITLKLTHFINWSWWWVLAPMWVPVAFFLFVLLMIMIGVALGGKLTVRKRKP
jgi:hypothetical protein